MLITELPLGSLVLLGAYKGVPLKWMKVDNQILCLSTNIGRFEFDSPEKDNPIDLRKDNGDNRYSFSNIDQFLNNTGENWYISTHEYDERPPYADAPSFLTEFKEDELDCMEDHRFEAIDSDNNVSEWMTRKVWLPSVNNFVEEAMTTHEATEKRFAKLPALRDMWTRSGFENEGSFAKQILSNGSLADREVADRAHIFPLCKLSDDVELEMNGGLYIPHLKSVEPVLEGDLRTILGW